MSSEPSLDYLRFPPEEEMDALVSRFFTDTGSIFPFIHRETFLDTYNRVRSINLRQFRRSWLGLLNAILTMATVTSASWDMSATDRAARAEIFFARAKALCLDQMLSGASLETVQAMLLMSQYLQGTHRSVMTWNIHGLAVKAAFQLGLHTTASLRSHSPLERETRTRTWYACVILDRSVFDHHFFSLKPSGFANLSQNPEHDLWPPFGDSRVIREDTVTKALSCYTSSEQIKYDIR